MLIIEVLLLFLYQLVEVHNRCRQECLDFHMSSVSMYSQSIRGLSASTSSQQGEYIQVSARFVPFSVDVVVAGGHRVFHLILSTLSRESQNLMCK